MMVADIEELRLSGKLLPLKGAGEAIRRNHPILQDSGEEGNTLVGDFGLRISD
jgi:hypothetical protein